MNDEIDITPLIDTGYVQKVIQEGQNAVFKNGRLVYIILDVDKPGKFFFDLRTVFNASTGEGGKDLKIMFMNNAVPWQLNGKVISIDGAYPSGERFHVTGSENQANSSLIDFTFPLGLFQEAGIYQFQFEITDESGNRATSHYCFFQVTQNATLLAADFKNGVNPFDSDYTKWKAEVDKQIQAFQETLQNLNKAVDNDQALLNSYINKAQGFVDTATQSAISKLLSSENTWTNNQRFKNATAMSMGANTFTGDNLNIDSSATLPVNTNFGPFKADQVMYSYNLASGYPSMLRNNTARANNADEWNKNWWLWLSEISVGQGKDFPIRIMHFDLNLDTSDVGKPIAQFQGLGDCNNAGSAQAVLGGEIQFHIDNQGNLILEGINGISGVHRYRFTAVF